MSSHREAPEISKDPVADNTDTYAFVSPDKPDTVTIITNYIPLEDPPGGPNFYEFGDDVLYSIHIDNDGDGQPDITYQFGFQTEVRNPDTFLYNTGPITALDSPNWNRRQFYTVTQVMHGEARTTRAATTVSRTLAEPAVAAVQHRPALDAGLPGARQGGRPQPRPAARRCSPASGTRASSSTWARSSTSATCARSRTCT